MKTLILAAAFSAIACCAHAQSSSVVYGGVEGGADRMAYLGTVLPLPRARIGEGWAVRLQASAGKYDYAGGPGTVDGEYWSGRAELVYQTSGAWGYANVAVGPRFTDTDLSPSDPSNEREGEHWDVGIALDGAWNVEGWRTTGYASYGVDMDEHFVRLDVTHTVGGPRFRLGAEVSHSGDPTFDRTKYGAVAVFSPSQAWEMRLSGGRSVDDLREGGYGTLQFVRVF